MTIKTVAQHLAVLALILGVSASGSSAGQRRSGADRDARQTDSSVDARQRGYARAFRDGADRGRFDREHVVPYNLKAKGYYEPSRGYEPAMGSKGQYQKGYGEGYKAGYDGAFRDAASRDGWREGTRGDADGPDSRERWGATDLADALGYRDGVTAGEYDRGRNEKPDARRSDAYRDADRGYSGSDGDRGMYQSRYRAGFARGYLDGYGRAR